MNAILKLSRCLTALHPAHFTKRTAMRLHQFLLISILVFGFAGSSHAAVLFSNLLQGDNGAAGFDSLDHRLASDFFTDSTPWTITSLTARMGNSSSLVTHTVTFSIFTDNGSGKPGTLVGVFDTPASIPASSFGAFTATTAGIDLQANTLYWVVGQQNAPESLGTVTWRFTESDSTDSGPFSTVPGTETQTSVNAGGIYVNSGLGNQFFRLEGVETVPEPSSLTLLAFAAMSIAVCSRRRHRRARPFPI